MSFEFNDLAPSPGHMNMSPLIYSVILGITLFVFIKIARRRFAPSQMITGFIICLLSIVLYGYYYHLVQVIRGGSVQKILEGSLSGTYQFRVLIPWIVFGLSELTGLSIEMLSGALQLLSLFAALLAMYMWLSLWMTREGALFGLFLTAAILPTSFHYWYSSEFVELALFTAGYAVIAVRPENTLAFLGILTTALLNKETGGFLLWPYCLVAWISGNWKRAAGVALAGALLILGIHFLLSSIYGKTWTHPIQLELNWRLFSNNLWDLVRHPRRRLNMFLIAGGLWPIVFWRFRTLPLFVRLCLTTAVPLLVTAIPFAILSETRIFHPVLPVLIAAIVWQLAPSQRREEVPVIIPQTRHNDLPVQSLVRSGVNEGSAS